MKFFFSLSLLERFWMLVCISFSVYLLVCIEGNGEPKFLWWTGGFYLKISCLGLQQWFVWFWSFILLLLCQIHVVWSRRGDLVPTTAYYTSTTVQLNGARDFGMEVVMGTTIDSIQRTNVKKNAPEVEQKIPVSTCYFLYQKNKVKKCLMINSWMLAYCKE